MENYYEMNAINFEYSLNNIPTPSKHSYLKLLMDKVESLLKHLNDFENAMYDLIKNIEFRDNRNVFQTKLKEDLKKVKSSGKIMLFADKITNMYEMSKDEYTKLINDKVTKTYQKTTTSTKTKIDKGTKHFAEKLKLEKKMEMYANQLAYLTLKDHKENFKTKLPCRLINPAKSEIGIVSNVELEK